VAASVCLLAKHRRAGLRHSRSLDLIEATDNPDSFGQYGTESPETLLLSVTARAALPYLSARARDLSPVI